MRYVKRFFQIFLPLLLLAAFSCALVLWLAGSRQESRRQELLSSIGFLGDVSGFSVTTGNGADFPSASGLSEEELKTRLEEMLALAEQARFNTVFFQARADGSAFYKSKYFDFHPSLSGAGGGLGAFDPLDYLCTTGLEKRVQVYALVDLAQGPDGRALDLTQEETVELLAASTAELGKKYPLGAVLFTGLDKAPEGTAQALLAAIRTQLKKDSPGLPLGLVFDGSGESAITPQLVSLLTGEGLLGVVVPQITAPVTGEGRFASLLHQWGEATTGTARLIAAQPAGQGEGEEELRLLLTSMSEQVSGVMLEHYGSLWADSQRAEELISLLESPKGQAPELFFSLPRELAISYPAGDVSVTDGSVFLMGTSDPEQPLTLDGEEVERTASGGSWGVYKKLEQGKNTFTLRQGERSASVTITRYTPSGTASPISGIQEGTIFPRYSCGVDSDEELTLSCMGPAGATITATLGERSIPLVQANASSDGTPAAFRGTLTLSPEDYDPNRTAKIGPVTYLLTYGGKSTTYQSQGEVYVAGRNVPLAVENTAQLSAVLTNPDDDESITGTLKPGARAYVEETVRTSRSGVITLAYKLRGGGYILAGTPTMGPMVQVLEGAPKLSMEIGEVSTGLGEDGSLTITLGEGTPAITTTRTEDSLVLDCRETTAGELTRLTNGFIRTASAEETEAGARITLRLEPAGELWGYDLYYQDGKTMLYLKPAPKRGDTFGKPLSGVSVMLDAGHGGSDPGAMGVAGESGPAEAQLNLAVTQALKYRLEQLGASVSLTRADDSQISLYQRVDAATEVRPDIFLSVHHNSGVLTGNMNQARRMECYYFEDISQPFAQALMDRLPGMLGRPGTEPEQARYYVTRQTANPAVLLEVGFMVNPLEYEECINPVNILKTACGAAEAILDIIK